MADFHINNLEFINENFKEFPNKIKVILWNLLANMLKLNEDEYNINLPKKKFGFEDESKKYGKVNEPDLAYICMRKLDELKSGIKFMKLIPNKREEIKVSPLNTVSNLKKMVDKKNKSQIIQNNIVLQDSNNYVENVNNINRRQSLNLNLNLSQLQNGTSRINKGNDIEIQDVKIINFFKKIN